ncbi:MAG: ArsR/SmtB family transcription factor [Candidatus Dormibacteria bacterium]
MAKSPPSEPAVSETVVLSDPRAMRAVAHAARIEIIRALFDGDELTATECARLTGLSPSATSYHLKALAKWGVVEAGARRQDGRDRPWRAKGRSLQLASDDRVVTGVAQASVVSSLLNQDREAAIAYVQREAQEPPEWRHALHIISSERWMTKAELQEIVAALDESTHLYQERTRRDRPAGSRRVRISTLVTPVGEPPAPGS